MKARRSCWARAGLVLTAVAVAAALAAALAEASSKATISTFAGTWGGHGRGLTISRSGLAHESINDGCCDTILKMTFRISKVRGTASSASARAHITAIHLIDPSWERSRPRVGETKRITLKHGVITEKLTGATYCDRKNAFQGVCGA